MRTTDERETVAMRLAGMISSVLVGSPFAPWPRWPRAVVILRPPEKRVTSRGDFAGWLAANDLPGPARECITRRVKPGQILVWLDTDSSVAAVAQFMVFDLAAALQRATTQERTTP